MLGTSPKHVARGGGSAQCTLERTQGVEPRAEPWKLWCPTHATRENEEAAEIAQGGLWVDGNSSNYFLPCRARSSSTMIVDAMNSDSNGFALQYVSTHDAIALNPTKSTILFESKFE